MNRDAEIEPVPDWKKIRVFEGIGWRIGSVARGDGLVMEGGFSVFHPVKQNPFSLKKYYVLSAFGLLPRGMLLVTVRKPEIYWPDYDPNMLIDDPVELVWLNDEWEEEDSYRLPFAAGERPDSFYLSPNQKKLLFVMHRMKPDGTISDQGHALYLFDLKRLSMNEIYLPEADGYGKMPQSWYPVKMQFQIDGDLMVQAGKELRIYDVKWY